MLVNHFTIKKIPIASVCTLLLLCCPLLINAQQIEFGPDISYWSTNIRYKPPGNNRRVDIGNSLPSVNYGFSAFYFFKKPNKHSFTRLGLLYRNHRRGSVSYQDDISKFAYASNIFGLLAGIGTGIGAEFSFFIDLGLGYNFIDNKRKYYFSNKSQVETFYDLVQDLDIKPKEWLFLYQMGIQKPIFNNKIKVFLDLYGDVGITSINGGGADDYFSYAFGIGAGVRYIINYIPNTHYQLSEDRPQNTSEDNFNYQSPNDYYIPPPTRYNPPPVRTVPRATPPPASTSQIPQ